MWGSDPRPSRAATRSNQLAPIHTKWNKFSFLFRKRNFFGREAIISELISLSHTFPKITQFNRLLLFSSVFAHDLMWFPCPKSMLIYPLFENCHFMLLFSMKVLRFLKRRLRGKDLELEKKLVIFILTKKIGIELTFNLKLVVFRKIILFKIWPKEISSYNPRLLGIYQN